MTPSKKVVALPDDSAINLTCLAHCRPLPSPVTDPDPTLDYIDYTSISYPSDQLAIGKIRKLYPHRFDVEGSEVKNFFDANAGTHTGDTKEAWLRCMLTAERYLARNAYEEALGKTWTCVTELGDTEGRICQGTGRVLHSFRSCQWPTTCRTTHSCIRGSSRSSSQTGPRAIFAAWPLIPSHLARLSLPPG